MTDDKILRLLGDLVKATEEGRIKWGETADEDSFRVVLKTGMIRIGQVNVYDEDNHEWVSGYSVTVMNHEGKIVEELKQFPGLQARAWGPMKDLFELARRSARAGESLLNAMLAEVEGNEPR